jgi:3-(3-hydroxy-phenyl)propionate hydroxylase
VSVPRVIVIGAGPVGVVAALALAQNDFVVTILEAEAAVDDTPRAATTHPATLELIARLGLIDRFIAEGLMARHFQFWDRPTRTRIAEFDHELLRGETDFPFVVQTEQHKLAKMGIEKLRQRGAQVIFQARAVALSQDDRTVSITAERPGGARDEWTADYAIAADGGRSQIRRTLGIEFEGYTWPERFIVLTTSNDFQRVMDCCYRNYFADPDEWMNLFKVAGDDGKGRWRAVFPSSPEESDEEALSDAAVQRRLHRAFPLGAAYDVAHRNLYKVHQRVAARFRLGRVFLAGDSAHVNNPIGGLGLNCGIHDAMELAGTLHEVEFRGADAALLDRYERRRRLINIEFVQETTVANKRRLEERDPQVRQAKLQELRRMAEDPCRHKQFLMRTSLLESGRKAQTIA